VHTSIIYHYTKFHVPSYSSSLDTAAKLKATT